MKSTPIALAGATLALLLAGCGDKQEADNATLVNASAPLQSNEDMMALLGEADGLDTTHDLVETAGLSGVLEGVGPYTLFAPIDEAYKALGDDVVDKMKDEAMKAEDAALLRAHIVPGLVTRKDIMAAIDAGKGSATMTTMAGGALTFAKQGDAVTVTADNGAKAQLTGDESIAANGAIEPVSAILLTANTASEG